MKRFTFIAFSAFFFSILSIVSIFPLLVADATAADAIDADMGGLEVGQQAFDFNLKTIRPNASPGEEMILLRSNNEKYMVLEFFSSWCGGCQENLPKIYSLATKTVGAASVKAVSLDRNEGDLLEYMTDHQQEFIFTVFIDDRKVASPAYKIKYIPTTYLLDENNRVLFKKVGTLTDEEVNQLIETVKR